MANSVTGPTRPSQVVTNWIREHQDPNPSGNLEASYFRKVSGQLALIIQGQDSGESVVLASFYDPKTRVATLWQFQGKELLFGQFAQGQWEQFVGDVHFNSYLIKFSHVGFDGNGDGVASWFLSARSFCLGLPLPMILVDSAYLATNEKGFTFLDAEKNNVGFLQKADLPQNVFDLVSTKSAQVVEGGPWSKIKSAEFKDIALHKRPALEELDAVSFPEKVLSPKSGITFVFFYGSYCEACHQIAPYVEQFAAIMGSKAKVYMMDVQKNPQSLLSNYVGRGIPSVAVFVDGEPQMFVNGERQMPSLVGEDILLFFQQFTQEFEEKKGPKEQEEKKDKTKSGDSFEANPPIKI